jgi:hypothetical protein
MVLVPPTGTVAAVGDSVSAEISLAGRTEPSSAQTTAIQLVLVMI